MFNKDLILYYLNLKKWSRYKLCKTAGMAQSTLSDILSGKNSNPRMDTIEKIAEALDVPVKTFFDETDNNKEYINKTIDNDICRIERARNKMSLKEKEKMMKILEASFEDYFEDED